MQLNLIIAIFVISISLVQSIPVPHNGEDVLPACYEDCRTVWDIIWSCATTIFACTWLSVHLNVPGHKLTEKEWFAGAMDCAKLMAIAVLAPEAIVAWAVMQLMVDGKYTASVSKPPISIFSHIIRKIMLQEDPDPPKLSMTHGFFLSMGGFYDTDTETLLDLDSFATNERLIDELQKVDVISIHDKSKGDAFSKAVSILQISWFVSQCIA
ncbi:uncharacterized protein EV420DRAFT_1485862 [Desarmillaria tabescens]|uniref:Uncharacterized protein n=1 Tax=Armillaria tabescens TaxID=1929756 RepID=A0AA39JEL6_ARMTA|nr:uncharacterized protein EV420DRAFT_1485862 [Desarmillaria tabescens]KAK0440652.1 hypothetical protein EV420DRAFT_1485862 [Desarmillaria tabescens]